MTGYVFSHDYAQVEIFYEKYKGRFQLKDKC